MQITLQDKNMKRICLVIVLAIWALSVFSAPAYHHKGDSVGVKQVDGSAFIIYKVSGGETVYAVSRKYGVPFANIVSANPGVDMNTVKAGQSILVPVPEHPHPGAKKSATEVREEKTNTSQTVISNHTVAKGETMYSISKRYNVPITDLTHLNPEVKNYEIKEGQQVRIPVSEKTNPVIVTTKKDDSVIEAVKGERVKEVKEEKEIGLERAEDPVIESTTPKEETKIKEETEMTPADREISSSTLPVTDKNKPFSETFTEYAYTDGLISAEEKGVATWIEGSNDMSTVNDRFYALHNSAPIGSVIKIRNLMNNRVIYAKVIGNLSSTEINEKVMVKLSAGAAQKLNVLDTRFVVEATYFNSAAAGTDER
ncbi:MAG: LysM peptidoglycan-binding domain-containing protein [Chitinophagales bacterium]|nr:LysM peptidoglycan-binding domain-containing protein [Chitinophagales bacterium]